MAPLLGKVWFGVWIDILAKEKFANLSKNIFYAENFILFLLFSIVVLIWVHLHSTSLLCVLVLFSDFRYQLYMPRKSSTELLPFDLEIESTLLRRKKVEAGNSEMEDRNSDRFSEGHSDHNEMPRFREPTLGDYWRPMMNEDYSGIRHQPIDANNFELKSTLINMVHHQQFGGNTSEDPNGHLSNFLQLCGTIKMNEVDHNVIKLKHFPFSLRDKARNWFNNLMPGSIDTWGNLVETFLTKFFPLQLTSQFRAEIM